MAGILVRHATREDMPKVMALIDRCFGRDPGWFARELPHLYADPEVWRTALIAQRDGTLVGHIGTYPLVLRLPGGGRLRLGGIGAVACSPEARGCGVMSALLRRSIVDMAAAGYPASVLWGDRWRYANYGWEPCGRRLEWNFDVRHTGGQNAVLDPTLPVPARAWNALPAGVILDPASWERHLARPGWRHGRLAGAAACWWEDADHKLRRIDLLSGPDGARHRLLCALSAGGWRVSVVCHGTWDPAWRLARRLASGWHERVLAQIAIWDLRRVLEAAWGEIGKRASGAAGYGALNLEIGCGRRRQALSLRTGARLRLSEPVSGAPTLHNADVVRALFGSPLAPSLPAPFDRIFPLRWALPAIAHV